MDIQYARIEGRTPGYYLTVLTLGLLAAAGTAATVVLVHRGLYLTGMTNRIPWGIQVTLADYYIGLSAGAMLVSGLYGVFGRIEYKSVTRLSAYLAMIFLLAGLLSILTDQGRMDRALVEPVSHFNLTSMFSINPFLYVGNIVLCVIYLWALFRDKPRLTRVVAVTVVGWAFVLHTGTGAILGFIPRDLHESALLPPSFLAAALASGTAVMILVFVTLFKVLGRRLDDELVTWLGRLLGIFVLVVVYVVLVDNAHRFYLTESREAAGYFLFGGLHSWLFWGGLLFLGCLVPILVLFHPKKGKSVPWVAFSAILVVFGIFCERYVIVIPGQTNPPDLFPGMDVTGLALEEGPAHYTVSIWEVLQALGVIGIIGLMLVFGLRFMSLTPTEARMPSSSGSSA